MRFKAITAAAAVVLGPGLLLGASASAAPPPPPAPAPFVSDVPQLDRTQGQDPAAVAAAKARAANRAKAAAVPPPTRNPSVLGASGRRPYGGDTFGTQFATGSYYGCTVGVATKSSTNAQYLYTAGHCMMDPTTGAPRVPTVTGRFWTPSGYGLPNPVPPGGANIGTTGHNSTFDNVRGDNGFIRANVTCACLYRETRTYNGVVYDIPAGGNPILNESASMVSSWNGHTLHGYVYNDNVGTVTFDTGRRVTNEALMYVELSDNGNRCGEHGDSGGTILSSPSQQAIGVLSGSVIDTVLGKTRCWLYFDRLGTTLSRLGQVLSPRRPIP